MGVPMISAISLYAKPSTSARYTARRKSSGNCCRASLMSESGRWSSASISADRSPLEVCSSAVQLPVLHLVGGVLLRLTLPLAVAVDVGVGQDPVQPRLEV